MYGGGRERTESICGGKGREVRVYVGEGERRERSKGVCGREGEECRQVQCQ